MRYQAVTFDFYGTLAEVDADGPTPWETLGLLGYPTHPFFDEVWNSPAFDGLTTPRGPGGVYEAWRRRQLAAMAEFVGVPPHKMSAVVEDMLTRDQSWTVKARAGARLTMERIRLLGLRIGICSNWDYAIDRYIAQAALPRPDAVVTSAEVGARKPHTRPFTQICEKLGAPPDRVLHVGDNLRADVAGALRAGLTPVWLTANPDRALLRFVSAVSELPQVLDLLQ